MSQYKVLNRDNARRFLRERDSEDPLDISELESFAGNGEYIDIALFQTMRDKLDRLKSTFPSRLQKRDPEGGRFEQEACEIVHQTLTSLPTEVLSDPEFWIWLSVSKFADIIEWRFATHFGYAKSENYGLGSTVENMFFRLWLRGEIGHDPMSTDPYELSKQGDQDLWRSHIIRQSYANARQISKALLRLQCDRLERPRLGVREIRELAKRLRRLHANVFYELLTESRANALVLELCADL